MKYDPEKHHQRSIQLKGYDYSQAGAYFVTICTKDRQCLFGEILDAFVIMPNHIHGIIVLSDIPVGAGFKPAPTDRDAKQHDEINRWDCY